MGLEEMDDPPTGPDGVPSGSPMPPAVRRGLIRSTLGAYVVGGLVVAWLGLGVGPSGRGGGLLLAVVVGMVAARVAWGLSTVPEYDPAIRMRFRRGWGARQFDRTAVGDDRRSGGLLRKLHAWGLAVGIGLGLATVAAPCLFVVDYPAPGAVWAMLFVHGTFCGTIYAAYAVGPPV